MDLDDAWLTPSQAARRIGISRQLFNDWRRRGRIKPNEDGLYLHSEVVDLELETRNCDRPGTWRRSELPIVA